MISLAYWYGITKSFLTWKTVEVQWWHYKYEQTLYIQNTSSVEANVDILKGEQQKVNLS